MQNKIIIIGAGIVGLATGYQLIKKNPSLKIIFVEKESDVSKHQTGNNSGVIHSGIYYKPGSLKARNCIDGYKRLIQFCDENGVKYNLCGKVIVATEEKEIPYLNLLFERGKENGLENLRLLSEKELKEYEPHVNGIRGIHVPQTGIIDYTEVSQKLKEILINAGAEFKFNEEVTDIKLFDDKVEVVTEKNSFTGGFVVSCAGLQSDRIAKMTNPDLPLRIIPFRGEYYKLTKEKERLVKTLIYPVPDPAFPFLGVHFTNLINGGVEAGPNAVFAFKREGYSKFSFSAKDAFESFTWRGFLKVAKKYWRTGLGEFYRSFSKAAFVKALRRLVPEINAEDLAPGGAGVRAQACDKTGGLLDDFYFAENKRAVHVCNAPSPAATASLAIGDFIAEKILKSFND